MASRKRTPKRPGRKATSKKVREAADRAAETEPGQTQPEWVSQTARNASSRKRPVAPDGEVREEEYGGPRDREGLRSSEELH